MKITMKILAAVAALGFAGTASAQNSSQATGHAAANLISPIALYAGPDAHNANNPNGNTSLGFGNIVSTTGGGTVSVHNDGSIDYSGDAGSRPGATQAGTVTAQTWAVTGQASFTYNISAPGSVTYGASPAWGSMTLTPNVMDNNPHTIPVGGIDYLSQGGTLTIPANQTPANNYSATWPETAAYN